MNFASRVYNLNIIAVMHEESIRLEGVKESRQYLLIAQIPHFHH
jgi:hypothetical protein